MLSNHKLTCVSTLAFFAFVFSLNPVRWSPLFSKSAALGLILAKHYCLKAIPILMADRIVENWGYRVVTNNPQLFFCYQSVVLYIWSYGYDEFVFVHVLLRLNLQCRFLTQLELHIVLCLW